MTSLGKKNCRTEVSQVDSRSLQIDMLNTIVDFCEKNNLRYYLSGGTLLGAIRHKGYIPWDDDIDINMPRPDIEKMFHISGGKLGSYMLSKGGEDSYSPACQWGRLYSDKIIIENFYGGASNQPYYHPIFVDIFPIDGFPDSDIATRLYCLKLFFIQKMSVVSCHDRIIAKNKMTFIAHVLAFIPSKIIGYKNWRNWLQKEIKRYDFDKCNYIGVTSLNIHLFREKVAKEEYLKSVPVEFEGKMYSAPENYDVYLRQLYGDYMKMPPLEKRQSHHKYKMYWGR